MPNSISTQRAASSESPEAVVDTVVLRCFLLVDEADLLLKLLGGPIAVPRIVYDPEEQAHEPADTRSEIARSILYQQRSSTDRARDTAARQEAAQNAVRLETIASLEDQGELVVLDLHEQELNLLGRLTSPTRCRDFGLRFPLGAGEAACLAMADFRSLLLVTEDSDALRALEQHRPGHPHERIRRLLIRAGESNLCTLKQANEIHHKMQRLGSWERDGPFTVGS